MWSLPDIYKLNEEAAAKQRDAEYQKKIEAGIDPETNEPAVCMYADNKCRGEISIIEWYDIFSDDPKGTICVCEHHNGYYGSPAEGYFFCDDCCKIFTENYTWERYVHVTEDGESLCLNCYAKRVLEDDRSWITLTKGNIKAMGTKGIGFERVRRAPHIIAVDGHTHGLKFIDNVEFDSMTGESISGGGLNGICAALNEAKKAGHKRAILILDAAYQFAVSIGVYVDGQ